MINNQLDLNIEKLQKEITGNASEIVRLQKVMEEEILELLKMQAERDRISGLKVRVLDSEVQMGVSYHGGRNQ